MKPPKYNVGDIISYKGFIYAYEDESKMCDKCGQILPGIEVMVEKEITGIIVRITIHIYTDSQKVWYGIESDGSSSLSKSKTIKEEDILERIQ